MKYIGILALAGLTACSVGYEAFQYEVTERGANTVKVQTHKGMLGMAPEQVAAAFKHMHGMATSVCQEYGKNKAVFDHDRQYTTAAYYAWVERTYRCR